MARKHNSKHGFTSNWDGESHNVAKRLSGMEPVAKWQNVGCYKVQFRVFFYRMITTETIRQLQSKIENEEFGPSNKLNHGASRSRIVRMQLCTKSMGVAAGWWSSCFAPDLCLSVKKERERQVSDLIAENIF